MDIQALHAFEDNYIWLLRDGRRVVAIDPGDASPVLRYLEEQNASLAAILITHHHGDHTGGIDDLLSRGPVPIFGPAGEAIAGVTVPRRGGDTVHLPELQGRFQVMDVPGHTRGHIAYYGHGALFCGDTLFACGCGRLFEGTPRQMVTSLTKLASLPDDTLVYCGHEYTQANLRFGRTVDPANQVLVSWEREADDLRRRGQPTLPSSLARERLGNPFLRCEDPAVSAAASREAGQELAGPVPVFAALREWKNRF